MDTPLHFDVEETRRQLTENYAAACEQALAACKPDMRPFVEAQRCFDPVLVEFHCAYQTALNQSTEHKFVAGAAGIAIGNLVRSMLHSLPAAGKAAFFDHMNAAMAGPMVGEGEEIVSNGMFTAKQGGTA